MRFRGILAVALILGAIGCERGEKAEVEETAETPAAKPQIDSATAQATALAQVPGGEVTAVELEEEGGRLIYSFDIKVEGQEGIEEVQVNAVDGTVVSKVHETPADEAAEAAEAKGEKEGAEAGEAEEEGETGSLVETAPGLLARAKITDEAARAAALAKVPGGRITGAELEEEGGKLIYSYDVKVEGKEGVEEVHVDALTGQVLSVEHEGG